jgi:Ca2+-binding RTX toxin-like protein
VLAGTVGDDVILGFDGADAIFEVGNGDTVDAGGGFDYVFAAAETANGGFTFTVAGTNVEFVYGGAGNDSVDAADAGDAIHFAADAGDDTLVGSAFEDRFDGGEGEDTIVLAGNYADYAIATLDHDGSFAIVEIATGITHWIASVEIARFNDRSWALNA